MSIEALLPADTALKAEATGIKKAGMGAVQTSIHKTAADYADLTWGNFFVNNLIPVTIGNVIGGAVLVGAVYWFVYLRRPAAA